MQTLFDFWFACVTSIKYSYSFCWATGARLGKCLKFNWIAVKAFFKFPKCLIWILKKAKNENRDSCFAFLLISYSFFMRKWFWFAYRVRFVDTLTFKKVTSRLYWNFLLWNSRIKNFSDIQRPRPIITKFSTKNYY